MHERERGLSMIRFLDGHTTVIRVEVKELLHERIRDNRRIGINSLKPNQEYVSDGGKKLESRWTKCSERRGD